MRQLNEPCHPCGTPASHLSFLSWLPVVPCREDLAELADRHFRRTGKAAEVGVFRGDLARHNLRHWRGEYHGIDAWQFRPLDSLLDKNYKDEATNLNNFKAAQASVAEFGSRAHLTRSLSTAAAATFANCSFDWIYIDALHSYEALKSDLHAWWPKLRAGGLLSGDDFGDANASVTGFARFQIPNRRGKKRTSTDPLAAQYDWGVVRATFEFAREVGGILQTAFMKGQNNEGQSSKVVHACYEAPAWYIVKPYARANV